MKKSLLVALALLASSSLFADVFKISCVDKYEKTLDFNLNLQTNTIYFTNIGAFGRGEMVTRKYLGIVHDFEAHTVSFEYNWYFQTTGTFRFEKKIYDYEKGDKLIVTMDFDDGDGIYTTDEVLNCSLKGKKIEEFF